jgi:hypothetical protein
LGIDPYTSTASCGSLPNTWIYSGKDMADGLAVDTTSDLITINPTSGSITVGKAKAAGTYQIKVIGTLPDSQTYSTIFTIIINGAPVFKTNL